MYDFLLVRHFYLVPFAIYTEKLIVKQEKKAKVGLPCNLNIQNENGNKVQERWKEHSPQCRQFGHWPVSSVQAWLGAMFI